MYNNEEIKEIMGQIVPKKVVYDGVEYPAARCLNGRGLVYGHGINDSPYTTVPTINNKEQMHPIYKIWKGMLKRAYSDKFHKKSPTYKDVTVNEEWLLYTNFEKWYLLQYQKENFQLDKDLLIEGNKEYSSNKCMFISQQFNRVLLDNISRRGNTLLGCHFEKSRNKYVSSINISDNNIIIGRFNIEQEAHEQYLFYKAELIKYYIKNNPFNDSKQAIAALYKYEAKYRQDGKQHKVQQNFYNRLEIEFGK